MTIIEFLQDFPDELSCKTHFKEQREKQGIICKKSVVVQNTIGFKVNGSGNAQSVVFGQP